MPHPVPGGASVRVTVIVSCSMLLPKGGGGVGLHNLAYPVSFNRERVAVGIRAQPVRFAELGGAHEIFVYIDL
jgi:hypothetical protein